nr:hypothetical protein GCM10025730_30000 [Promicromonospora thailandica]
MTARAPYPGRVNPRPARAVTVPAVLVLLVSVLLGLGGPAAWAASAPAAPAAPAEPAPVVVVGVAGLRWTDVSRSTTPNLWHMIGGGSVASINVRTAAPATCPLDAWLTLSAGSRTVSAGSAERADAPDAAEEETPEARGATSCTPVPRATGTGGDGPAPATVEGWAGLPVQDDDQEPAVDAARTPAPGLLGELLDEAGACTTAVGPGAAVMLARENGTVDRYVPSLDAFIRAAAPEEADDDGPTRPAVPGTGWGDALTECPVTVVDAGSLPEGPERAAALDGLDDTLSTLRGGLPSGTRVLVAGIADTPLTQQGLQVVVDWVADVPRVRWLTSEASRSTGFVQLTDLTATAAEAGGALPDPEAEVPGPEPAVEEPAIDGMPVVVGEPRRTTVARTVENRQYINVLADTIPAQVPAFAGAIVLFLLVAVLVLVLPRRTGRPRREPGPYRRRLALGSALLAVSAPAAASLATLARWWVWPAPEFGLALSLTVATVVLALAVRGLSRLLPPVPSRTALAAAAVTWLVFTVDGLTGFTLLQGSLLGPSLATADRFYGFSDVAFALYAGSGLLLAAGLAVAVVQRRPAGLPAGGGRPARVPWAAPLVVAAVALVTVAVDAAPFLGDRTRGLLLLVPFALAALLVVRPGPLARYARVRRWLTPPVPRTAPARMARPVRGVPSAVLGLSGALLLSLLFAAALLPVPGADAAGEESGSLSAASPIVPRAAAWWSSARRACAGPTSSRRSTPGRRPRRPCTAS